MQKRYIHIIILLLLPVAAMAQMDSTLFSRDYNIAPETTGELTLDIDNLSFFKDNEWNGNVTPGYTLPGLWVQPRITYTAIPELRLEAGFHALLYSGTTKYPNTIYRDIAEWKGNQYQHGAHVLPFFRANLQMGNLHFVLGSLYGGTNHRLSDAMYSAELNLTADPETGLQMLIDSKRLHFDMWANWESFIFKNDNHKESFVFGLSTQYSVISAHQGKQGSHDPLTLSLAVLAHHRGGEIDTTGTGVKTVMNGSFGIRYNHATRLSWLRSWSVGTDILGYYQQKGGMWPKDNGWALYAEAKAAFAYGISAKVGYQLNRDFISILSYPYYGCMSLSEDHKDATYHNPQLLTARIDWTRPFGKRYAVGVRAEMFQYVPNGNLHNADGTLTPEKSSNSLCFGIFLKANPSFLLSK